MNKILISLLAMAGTSLLVAQLPPPGGTPATATTVASGLSQFNYGPNGGLRASLSLPAHWSPCHRT